MHQAVKHNMFVYYCPYLALKNMIIGVQDIYPSYIRVLDAGEMYHFMVNYSFDIVVTDCSDLSKWIYGHNC